MTHHTDPFPFVNYLQGRQEYVVISDDQKELDVKLHIQGLIQSKSESSNYKK